MTADEKRLLLTIARIFRARIIAAGGKPRLIADVAAQDAENLEDLRGALTPFDPLPGSTGRNKTA